MPAPCPGDPDYPADELPLTRENVEREFERLRERRLPMLAELDRVARNPDGWDAAAWAELAERPDGRDSDD